MIFLMFRIWEIGKVLILFCWEFGQLMFSYLGALIVLCCVCVVLYGNVWCFVVLRRIVSCRAPRKPPGQGRRVTRA